MIVAKISGRLVEHPELESRLAGLLEETDGSLVLIAGGGAAADLVRLWDQAIDLRAFDAHWLAVRAMSLQAELLARRLDARLVRSPAACQDQRLTVLDLWDELNAEPDAVPTGWHVTSDSLAAWAAKRLGAAKLILLKRVGDLSTSVENAVAAGWVDSYFPTAAAGLQIEWRPCNF